MNGDFKRLSATDPAERVLLLSHCLRPSRSCPGKFDRSGLICPENCQEDCVVGRLAQTASSLGYKGVCIAAGGKMAVKFVAEHKPRGIVAIACERELEEGVDAVNAMAGNGLKAPTIVGVPLLKDGCVDTEVDEEQAMSALALGCCVRPK